MGKQCSKQGSEIQKGGKGPPIIVKDIRLGEENLRTRNAMRGFRERFCIGKIFAGEKRTSQDAVFGS